jgi:hypothetical protein
MTVVAVVRYNGAMALWCDGVPGLGAWVPGAASLVRTGWRRNEDVTHLLPKLPKLPGGSPFLSLRERASAECRYARRRRCTLKRARETAIGRQFCPSARSFRGKIHPTCFFLPPQSCDEGPLFASPVTDVPPSHLGPASCPHCPLFGSSWPILVLSYQRVLPVSPAPHSQPASLNSRLSTLTHFAHPQTPY